MARLYWTCDRCGKLLPFDTQANHMTIRKVRFEAHDGGESNGNGGGKHRPVRDLAHEKRADYCDECAEIIFAAMEPPNKTEGEQNEY